MSIVYYELFIMQNMHKIRFATVACERRECRGEGQMDACGVKRTKKTW